MSNLISRFRRFSTSSTIKRPRVNLAPALSYDHSPTSMGPSQTGKHVHLPRCAQLNITNPYKTGILTMNSSRADRVCCHTCEPIHVESDLSLSKILYLIYNKAAIMSMDDGREVIAKVPNPNAGVPHFTTASEVATMDLPHVRAYSCRI
jgi:hypothetical protein